MTATFITPGGPSGRGEVQREYRIAVGIARGKRARQ